MAQYEYRLPDTTLVIPGNQFSLGGINYPSNWIEFATQGELDVLGITKSLIVEPPKTPQEIVDAQSGKILQAFGYMEQKLSLASIEIPITSANTDCSFGCDQTTQDNIIGIIVAITAGIPIPNPTYWTPKGYPFPILVTHTELITVGGLILNKKNELYTVYFGHKTNIMMSSDYNEIVSYNVTTGY